METTITTRNNDNTGINKNTTYFQPIQQFEDDRAFSTSHLKFLGQSIIVILNKFLSQKK